MFSLLYLTFFKTILAALFRTIILPLLFLSSKPSFLDDHYAPINVNPVGGGGGECGQGVGI